MNELVNLVSQRAGIPAETAQTAVETVLGYLKEKLPGPIASQIDGVLSGSASPSDAQGMLGNLGNPLDRG